MDPEIWQAIGSIAALVAAGTAVFALLQAKKIFDAQQALTQKIHNQQILLAQRQLFLPLFEQFKDMASIDPDRPVWPDVVRAVNFLELLGVCWEGQLIDEKILFRVFREFVIDSYAQIKRCDSPSPDIKSGEAMLRESRAATTLYNFLLEEHINRDRPGPIGDAR